MASVMEWIMRCVPEVGWFAGRRFIPASALFLLLTLSAFSAGEALRLEAEPIVASALPGHSVTIRVSRSDGALDRSVALRFENLSTGIVDLQETAVIPEGESSIEIPVSALASGGANIRVSANGFGQTTFTINVLEAATIANAVSPESISLRLGKGQSETVAVSAATPAGSVVPAVDVAFAIDGRFSYIATVARLAAAFPALVDKLKTDYPGVSFAFSVSKFGDFGGPGKIFSQYAPRATGAELDRPYVLLLPMTLVNSPADVNAVVNAMLTPMPGPAYHSIGASYLEALQQIALGTGFDGDGNGSMLDSGPAGLAGGGTQRGFLSPGGSGDVPPFSSKPSSLVSAGNLGGVGFRTGAQRIVILSTNTLPVSPLDGTLPVPDAITGANGVKVSTVNFQTVISYPPYGPFLNKRFGPVSDSVSTAIPANAVAPKGAATLPDVFKTLAAQGIQVVNISQATQFRSTPQIIDPQQTLSAISRLTGAVDALGVPMAYELMGGTIDQVVRTLVLPIRASVLKSRTVTLQAVGNDAGFGFTFLPASVEVAPGDQAAFTVTLTGTGSSGSFEIQFVTQEGTIIGRIPVTLQVAAPAVKGVSPPAGEIGSVITISGTDLLDENSPVGVTVGGIQAQVSSVTATAIQATVPPGLVAGQAPVVATIGSYKSSPLPFTVLHTITSFSPVSGVAGVPFQITGNAFAPSPTDNLVFFGTTPAALASATLQQVKGTVPLLIAGPQPVTIATNGVLTPVGMFTAIPAITTIAPTSGPGYSGFTITGTGFSPAPVENTIIFTDGTTGITSTAEVTGAGLTSVSGIVPNQLTSGNYTVKVLVRGQETNAVPFAIVPGITYVTPISGPGGSAFTIYGSGFSPSASDNTIQFADNITGAITVVTQTSTRITALTGNIPVSMVGGNYSVRVLVRGVASNTVAFMTLPAISVSPSTVAIGGQLRISGTGFSTSLAENLVTISGRIFSLDPGSSVSALLVTIPPGTTGTSLEVMVTVRGAASNRQTVALSPNPIIFSAKAVFQTRETILITVYGADANGDIKSLALTVKDGAGQVLGDFPAISLQSALSNQPVFIFSIPLSQANHFTAASTVALQLTDLAGNTSAVFTTAIVNPDIRPAVIPRIPILGIEAPFAAAPMSQEAL
jgi:hypothetical protein